MPKVFDRLAKQVSQRRQGLSRHPGVHTMLNNLLSYCLQVNAFLAEVDAATMTDAQQAKLVDCLAEGEDLKEFAKQWLAGK